MRFADLPQGFVIAHRGGALQVPEDTLEAHRATLALGVAVLEQDVQVLADGALGVMHDGTVERTTTATGNVADHTAASWARLVIDAGTQLGGGWGDDVRPPLFEEVLAEFGDQALLCPEAKSPGTMGPMLDALERRGTSRSTVLAQSFSLADCELAHARGWAALWLGCTDPERAAAHGIGWVGVPAPRVTGELCARARAAGVRVACYTVDRRWQRDAVRAAGVDAIFSDDPGYLHDGAPGRARDLFAVPAWQPGVQADGRYRGRLLPDQAAHGFDLDAGTAHAASWALVGYLRPPDPGAFVLEVAVSIDATAGDGPAGAASVLLSTTDRPFTDPPGDAPRPPLPDGGGVDGVEVVLARSGALRVAEVAGGAVTGRGAAAAGPGVALGEAVVLRVEVTAAGVSATRAGAAGAAALGAPAPGPLPCVHLGRRGAAVRFAGVVLS